MIWCKYLNQRITENNCRTRFCIDNEVPLEVPAKCVGCARIAHIVPEKQKVAR